MRGVVRVEVVRTVDDSAGLKVVKTVGQMVGAAMAEGMQAVGTEVSSVVAMVAARGVGVMEVGALGAGEEVG